MKENFIGKYQITKTLRFSLIPIGKTEEYFNARCMLEEDEQRAEDYVKVKSFIDEYHKAFIERILSNPIKQKSTSKGTEFIEKVRDYADLYNSSQRDDKKLNKIGEELRKSISEAFTKDDHYDRLFNKDIIEELLPEYLGDSRKEDTKIVENFVGFKTYFNGFFENRKNMYVKEQETTAIAYRCIDENLPRFLDNATIWKKKLRDALPEEDICRLNKECTDFHDKKVEDIFDIDFFTQVLSQSGIDWYNQILGGYTKEGNIKIQGLNEYINTYNDKVSEKERSHRLPLLKPLYKQILSDRVSTSFIPEKFTSDEELLSAVHKLYTVKEDGRVSLKEAISEIKELFAELSIFNLSGIFVSAKTGLSDVSNRVFGYWGAVKEGWIDNYHKNNPLGKRESIELYEKKLNAEYGKISSFSIEEIQQFGEGKAKEEYRNETVIHFYSGTVSKQSNKICDSYKDAYKRIKPLLEAPNESGNDLRSNKEAIELLKTFLDNVKELEFLVKPFRGEGNETDKDNVFYSRFLVAFDAFSNFDLLYDKVRNYITQKPFSTEKIKLNFNNPQFLGGWHENKESSYSSILLRSAGKYYLGVMDTKSKHSFKKYPSPKSKNDVVEKMFLHQVANPAKDVQNLMVINGKTVRRTGRKEIEGEYKGENLRLEELKNTHLPEEINRIRKSQSYLKSSGENFSKQDLVAFIKFYMERTKEYYTNSHFEFRNAENYQDFKEFTDDIDAQAYQVHFKEISHSFINSLVDKGELYLFQIYNKDFSPYSRGTPNLHTLYFKMLFDERNLADVIFKLDGNAEMFYRKASLKKQITHPANKPIPNKNTMNPKKESTFGYDIIKDKRYTERQFSLHFPITLNFKAAKNANISKEVRDTLYKSDLPYIIGIDRGERNLLYICVIDGNGNIVEQISMNEITTDNNYKVNYHNLLQRKEEERKKARGNWSVIENIKELKEGYLSQVINKICGLVIKYNAVIAMENLNYGFKRGRFRVEKQVYQKFENNLIKKLNYLADKKLPPEQDGGLLRAYQLTEKFEKINKSNQNGIIFFVPAWLTSKIDPTTGFTNLLYPRYESVKKAKNFFANFSLITYDASEDMFRFDFDYTKFLCGVADFKKKWSVWSYGERIKTRRKEKHNNDFEYTTVQLTDEFKNLFENYRINYSDNLQKQIIEADDKEFFYSLYSLLNLTLQMRNSNPNSGDDYLISPVRNTSGGFYDSRNYLKSGNLSLPVDADANGAYNIARKCLWQIMKLKSLSEDETKKPNLTISNKDWLCYAQENK